MKKNNYLYILIIGLFALVTSIRAQSEDTTQIREAKNLIQKQLPRLLGTNNAGTEFFMTFHPCWETTAKQNFVRIYISSAFETDVTLEIASLGIVKQIKTIPNDIIEFILFPEEAQMYSKPGSNAIKPLPAQVWAGRAIHITSNDPIICYGVTRFWLTSDGFLALPVSSLGKRYTVSSYADPTQNLTQYLPSFTSIVGIYDATKVDFTVGGNESMAIPLEDGVSEAKVGETVSRILNTGDVWLIPGKYAFNDLSGSTVRANKPVSVFSGNFCAYIPTEVAACDFIIEQELPQSSWGYKYHVTSIIKRLKNSFIKIYPKENDTDLYKDNQMFGTITLANGLKGSGWIERRADDGSPRPVVFSSNKPIYVVQYNTGQDDDHVLSDPFQMVLTPKDQYQKEIIWNTPGIKGGFGFQENYINIAYKATLDGGLPKDIEFAEVQAGSFHWKSLVDIDALPGSKFSDTANDGRIYYSKTFKLISDGVYMLRANDPFAAYAYGFDPFDSYGFPTSVSVSDLEVLDSLKPVIFFNQVCNGNVSDYYDPIYNKDPYWGGLVRDEPENDPENMAKLSLFYMDPTDSYNYKLLVQPFQVGIDYKTLFRLNVVNALSDARAHLVAIDRRGNRADTVIEFYSQNIEITPNVCNFGIFKPGGTPVTKSFLLTNTSPKRPIYAYKLALRTLVNNLNSQGFIINLDTTLLTKLITPGQSISFTITFNPTQNGYFQDSVGAGCPCCYKNLCAVRATVGESKIDANDYAFPEQIVGTRSKSVNLSIINRINDGSNTRLTISKAIYDKNIIGDSAGGKPFEINLSNGMRLDDITEDNPIFINLDSAFHFTVTFNPGTPEEFASKITWIADADIPKNYTSLTGTAVQPALIVNDEDWHKRRSDMNFYKNHPPNNFTFTPYPSPRNAIQIINGGKFDVTLGKPEITEDINGNDFGVYLNGNWTPLNNNTTLASIFDGIVIRGGKDTVIPVYFHPQNMPGLHRLRIAIKSNVPENTESLLEGIAIWGKVRGDGYDFGKQIIGNNKLKGQIVIWNEEWENSDSVRITGFSEINLKNATISSDPNSDAIFTYDLNRIKNNNDNNVSIPITLHTGDSIFIPCTFNPKTDGKEFSASIETVSDAENEALATLTGSADSEGSFMTGDTVTICKGSTVELHPAITNTGSVPIHVTNAFLIFKNGTGIVTTDFEVLDKDFIIGTKDSGEDTKTVRIRFTPSLKYTGAEASLILKFETNSLRTIFGDSCIVEFNSKSEQFNTRSEVSTSDSPGFSKETTANIGKNNKVTYSVFLDHSGEQADFGSNYFDIDISYRKDFLALETINGVPQIKIGKDLAYHGYKIISQPLRSMGSGNIEKIHLRLGGTSPIMDPEDKMEILDLTFVTYLPSYTADQSDLQELKDAKPAIISHNVMSDAPCNSFVPDSASVSLDPVCFQAGRQPIFSSNNFGLNSIAPNPIDSRGANIEFSVGWDNSFTEIKVYSSDMKLIDIPVSETLSEGRYQTRLPIEKMQSGVYFIRMTSSYFASPLIKCIVEK